MLELVEDFTKIVLSAFRPYIGYHQGLFACVERVFQNYVNAELDADGFIKQNAINGNKILSRNMEYLKEKKKKKKKKKFKRHFKTMSLFSKF